MAQINVKNERLNVLCVVSSPHEIAFAEAERISLIFINNLTDLYGENLFPVQNQHEFQFELFVDTKGELLSLIPPPNLSLNPSSTFAEFLRLRR